ncbi:MAG: ABC transporter ATP-binding protein [Xenococcaceae cyanobacterium MO_167.B27]|nr:ABC transporter ATP-binding protein [Xenococcaceae cyanobacterium MO_167.B27]
MIEPRDPLLSVEALVTGYGNKQVLNSISVQVAPGEIVALIGHNGAGKSTLLKAIFGLLPIWQGKISFQGKVLRSAHPSQLRRQGVVYVPQGSRVFADFTVGENLEMGGLIISNQMRIQEGIERVLTLFPSLKSRWYQKAATLSGGEKQMLALATALILSPRLLLLDEPSLGLAPRILSQAFALIQQINADLNVAVLIVEQKVREVLKIAHYVYVLRNGRVSSSGTPARFDDTKLWQVYL